MSKVGASEHGEPLSFARSHVRVLRFGGPAIVRRGRRPVALRPPHWRGLLLTALGPISRSEVPALYGRVVRPTVTLRPLDRVGHNP